MTIAEESLQLHYEAKGKIRIAPAVPTANSHDLALAYTPGVAVPCMEIHNKPETVWEYTCIYTQAATHSCQDAVATRTTQFSLHST